MDNNGWKNLDEVWIPPIEKIGFQENVIIRRPIAPATVLLSASEESFEESPTVLLTEEIVFSAWLKRTSNGEKIQIDKDEFIIGKSGAADYVIYDNATVSRQHAVIRKMEDGYYLEDLKSANHTFVDGVMITKPVKLVNGSVIWLSKEAFIFMLI